MRVLVPWCLVPCVAACASVDAPPVPPPPGLSSSVELSSSVDAVPAVVEARAAWEASQGRTEQAGLWPNPRLRLQARDVPLHPTVLQRGGRWVELMQPIAVGGRIAAATSAAECDGEASAFDLESARRRALADIAAAAAEVESARAILAASQTLAAVDDAALASARRRSDQGAASDADVAALEVAAGQSRADVSARAAELAGAEATLRTLVPDGPPPRLVPGAATSYEAHPDVLAAEARVRAAEARLDEARAQRIPDIEVSLGYGQRGEDDVDLIEAGVTVPLPVFDRNQGRVRETLHLVSASRAAHERIARDVVARIARSTADVSSAAAAADVYSARVLPAADALLAQMERGAASGVRAELDVLAARRSVAVAHKALAEAERQRALAAARRIALFGVVGEEVER